MDTSPEQPTDLRTLLRALSRRKWLVLLCTFLLPIAAYLLSASIKKTYRASAIVQTQGAPVDTSLFGAQLNTTQVGAIAATAKLAQSILVATNAARYLRVGGVPNVSGDPNGAFSPLSLLSSTAVTEDDATGFVTISATDRDAARSANIANAFADATVILRQTQARAQVRSTVNRVAADLAALPRQDATARMQLSDQLQRLRALSAAQTNVATIIKTASKPTSPASPKPIRNAALAFVLGLLLGVGLALVLDRLDRRIRTPQELEELTRLPLLAAIPHASFRGPNLAAADHEPFHTLRASLRYFNVDRPLSSIVVTSAAAEEGKTTVTINLAVSIARTGKDVIVLDTDLRRSQLANRLALRGGHGGLGHALTDDGQFESFLVSIPAEPGSVSILPAGPPVPNPSELISSERMRLLVKQASEKADIVLIDSAPLLAVSDIVPLLGEVSGVLIVARMKRTDRDGARRVVDQIQMAGGTPLGIVATDAASAGYGYDYAYAAPGRKRPWQRRRSNRVPPANV
ncbi:MAG: Wzz/FepE/Etk N-terminal domain-containing protein [Solirubrobacteraceae bacterium]